MRHTGHILTIYPETLGATVKALARDLARDGEQLPQPALLYAEKAGGFQCRTCAWATAVNATHGRCQIMEGTVHLDEGCCLAWEADRAKLHLYREHEILP